MATSSTGLPTPKPPSRSDLGYLESLAGAWIREEFAAFLAHHSFMDPERVRAAWQNAIMDQAEAYRKERFAQVVKFATDAVQAAARETAQRLTVREENA